MDMTLKQLMGCVSGKHIPAEFENQNIDYEAALRDQIIALCGNSTYGFDKHKYELFELITEAIDEQLPQYVEDAIGVFAEIMTVPQGARCSFTVKLGRQRAKSYITRATNAGVYETFRLDRGSFELYPHTYGSAAYIDFERYMDGLEDMAEMYGIILDGILNAVYKEIQGALLSSWNDAGRPAANKVYVSSFDSKKLRDLCTVVAAYGAPVIYCSPQFAANLANFVRVDDTVRIAEQDVMDVRERGYVGKFFGTPVVVLPQGYEDAENTKLVFNPSFAYVIPSGKEKIVKVAFEGETQLKEVERMDWGREIQCYKKLAAGIVSTPNFWGLYFDASIDDGGWAEINDNINA